MGDRRTLILGTAGHIDHGKTALVRALTGVDTDRLPAEKQRGITIDLGFAPLDLGDVELGLVDVPGHERFIRNMLAGATGFDLALLIVAADDSIMPQTREHADILKILGLVDGVVAITKCDLVDPAWIGLVEEETRSLLAGSPLSGCPIVRTSSSTGEGIDRLRGTLREVALKASARPDPGLFRLPIDRAFSVAGHGTVVTGTVVSGRLAIGDELRLWPEDRPVRVRGIHHHDRSVDAIARGARAAVNLVGVRHDEIRRGMELASPGYLLASRVLSTRIAMTRNTNRSLRHRARYRLHIGTAEVRASLALLDGPELTAGETAQAQLFLEEPVVTVHGQPFVLRSESPAETLGGGTILQPVGRRIRRRDQAARDRLTRLSSEEPVVRAAAAIGAFGIRAWAPAELVREAGISIGSVVATMAALTSSKSVLAIPIGQRRDQLLSAEVVSALEDRMIRALTRLHERSPRSAFVRRERLFAELADLRNDTLVSALIDRLVAIGRFTAGKFGIALRGHVPRLTQAERRALNELANALEKGRFAPPECAELATLTRQPLPLVLDLLALLGDEGRAVSISRDFYIDAEAELQLRGLVRERLADGSSLTMAGLRDLLGTTRKYAVPIGEYLDRIGLTVREGDERKLAPASNPSDQSGPS